MYPDKAYGSGVASRADKSWEVAGRGDELIAIWAAVSGTAGFYSSAGNNGRRRKDIHRATEWRWFINTLSVAGM